MLENKITNIKNIIKKIFYLMLPMAGSQFINVASGFLCMAMLARLGHHTLAASALIFSTQTSVMVTGMSILYSLNFLASHAYGEKNYSAVGNFLQQGWVLSLLISIPIILIFSHIKYLLIALGQSLDISQVVQTFFHAYAWGVAFFFLSVCNQMIGYSVHKQKLMMSTSLFGVIILLITAYGLIFGKLGMPQLGIAGLGHAMSMQFGFFFVFTTLFFYFEKYFEKFDFFTYRIHKNLNYIIQMLKVGWPICLQMSGELLSFFVNAMMVGWLGTVSLAAYQVVNQYLFLILVPIFSLGQASGILMGQARGGKQFHEIKILGYASIIISFAITVMVALVFLLVPKNLASFYFDINNPANTETLHLVILLFSIVAISQIFDGIRNVLTGIARGLFDTKFPMVIGIVVIWLIGIPSSYLLGFNFHYGIIGIAVGSTIGIFIGALLMMYRWNILSNQYNSTENLLRVN